jgi:Rps23 Pro-64 3,4-dihydroxylase Tpa1-like proline 4-hydroxylase
MAPLVLFDEFLVTEELCGLLKYTLDNARRFRTSEVVKYDGGRTRDGAYRRSRVLFELGPYHALFVRRLLTFLPYVLQKVPAQLSRVAEVEIQLTATNHSEYFRMHTDNDERDLRRRKLTFVYFFHREPRRFWGGELQILGTAAGQDASLLDGLPQLIYPLQNQVVFFPSGYSHQILPVMCPSRRFPDSRFTVNGWFRD